MRIPTADVGALLDRGIYKAPWRGPRGEFVLLAVASDHRLVTVQPVVVPLGASLVDAADGLWAMLDELDALTEADHAEHRRRQIRAI